jgi:hypothetical protein
VEEVTAPVPVVALAPFEVVAPALLEDTKVSAPLTEEEAKAGAAQEAEVMALLWRRMRCRGSWRILWRQRRWWRLRRWLCWWSVKEVAWIWGCSTVATRWTGMGVH